MLGTANEMTQCCGNFQSTLSAPAGNLAMHTRSLILSFARGSLAVEPSQRLVELLIRLRASKTKKNALSDASDGVVTLSSKCPTWRTWLGPISLNRAGKMLSRGLVL